MSDETITPSGLCASELIVREEKESEEKAQADIKKSKEKPKKKKDIQKLLPGIDPT